MGRDEQLSKERDEPVSRQETAREAGEGECGTAKAAPPSAAPAEERAGAERLKPSGGDPPEQQGD
ncbi:hypothetical protein OJF2_71430 [Aquisphaera giovannonii]|uniref:Uncharacterized protein n=1 Tax=Aquisphaera giovannonii TaxID=406548 RepID=A0A5B9WF80_9BACT|nr:hypothetical protein [Aquisphaera giovannonii]QEH38540.1 hypothetical protein OJF2_71430 [Aquisphaera giovannonii]